MVKTGDIGGKRLISLAPNAWAQWVTQQDDVVALEILSSEFHWGSRNNEVPSTANSPSRGRQLIRLAPTSWTQWVTQQNDVVALEILSPDLQWVSRENEVLIKAYSPSHGKFLIANELQLHYSDKVPWRIKAYAALATEQYDLPTYPVVVNILPPTDTVTIANHYESNLMGLRSRQDYRVINLWEVDAEIVFEQSLKTLLPFVPVLKHGEEVRIMQQAVNQLRQDEELADLESLLAFFATFVLESEVLQQIMRWDMAVLRESPWYQEILQEGKQEGERSLILKLLTHRLGDLSPELTAQVQALALAQIEALGQALSEFTQPDDLLTWLQRHTSA